MQLKAALALLLSRLAVVAVQTPFPKLISTAS